MTADARVLVVDDEDRVRKLLTRLLQEEGCRVQVASSGREALEALEREAYDLVLTDLTMPGMSGMDLLSEIREKWSEMSVILVTAFGTVESAVEAMHKGAFHYITKPFKLDEVRIFTQRALQEGRTRRELAALRREVHQKFEYANIIGKSKAMQDVFSLIERVAPSNSTVLIQGKSGTGKELVAKAIHYNSPRRRFPFVPINCSAIAETLLESELFGHVKGAFTGAIANKKGIFEEAQGGTVFLDEIADTSPGMQVKLLRVLQEHEIRRVGGNDVIKVDVRLIASTNQDLAEAVREGNFREDFYYRLNVIPLSLPPLKDRPEDIPLLARHFLAGFAAEAGREVTGISTEAMRVLMHYAWPGNIRELENVIERAVTLGAEGELGVGDLPPSLLEDAGPAETEALLVVSTIQELEKAHISRVLKFTGGQISKAARILGIDRRTLYRKIDAYKIQPG
ncbi:MAG: sigma-54 dependent transcriptional regulator [Nitrospinota bacterium]|nr:sigma-54 dependent transcriptional regulator [Nitrospinota bacterium]HJM42759.1 sigma-54 dependent transcriptional regulator [Nitrospinota bacterium]